MLSFVLNDVEKTLGDQVKILKVNFDENKDLTAKYEVKGYPTIIILKDGVEVKRLQGLQQKPALIKALQEQL
jgi:thioredoxin 1